jgi:formylglycine-generating enzyme required for sulfatase activity
VLALARKHLHDPEKAAKFVNYTEHRAHLLVGRGGQTELYFSFPHRTFQEYLAARHLIGLPDFGEEAGRRAESGGFWRTVLLMAAEELVLNHGPVGRNTLLLHLGDILPETCPRPDDTPGWQRVWRAGEMLAVLGPTGASATAKGQKWLKRLQTDLAGLLTGGELTPPERAEAGQALAVLGDFRKGVGLDQHGLPDLAWREVMAGEFIMGEERTPHRVSLPAFQISQFPITNVQFSAFVKEGGYQTERFWPEAIKAGYWREPGLFRGGAWDDEGRARPYDFGSPFTLPNHPVVGVSWYEAVAFCRWLSEKLDRLVRLPTEAEWEKAARGVDGHKYPWGNEEEVSTRCNMSETGINATSAVGMFPSGASPYGALDMGGNVWEWCSTIWEEKPDPFKVQDEWAKDYLNRTNVLRVLRGGAFSSESSYVRCAARYWYSPYGWYNYVGFRVVLRPK